MVECLKGCIQLKVIKFILAFSVVLLLLSSCTISKDSEQSSSLQLSTSVTEKDEKKDPYNESTEGTSTITIDGVVYRNKFQGDLILRNPMYEKEPVLIDNTGRYFRLQGIDYDLIYDVTSKQIGHSESIYCRDDQWQELKSYYSNTDNFTYQYITNQKGGKFEAHTVNEMDINKLNKLVEFCEENSYDPFGFSNSKKTRTVSTSTLGKTEYRFGMNSNDGLFSVGAASFYLLENNLVLEYYSVMSEGKTLIVDVPKELSDYFVSMISDLDK